MARSRKCRPCFPALVWPRSAAFWGESKVVFGTFGSRYAVFDWATNTGGIDDIMPDASINAVALFKDDVYAVGDAGTVFRIGEKCTELGSLQWHSHHRRLVQSNTCLLSFVEKLKSA